MESPQWVKSLLVKSAGSTNIVGAADYALDRLKALEIQIPRDSRLDRARRHVDALHDPSKSKPSNELLAEAARSIFEMYWITRALGALTGHLDGPLATKLREMLAGPDLPRDENDSSCRSRNTQFELFFGAWLTAGGIAVDLGEPDLLMEFAGTRIGVAAKRVSSRKTIQQRIRKGIKQIAKHTGAGIIALNVDRLLGELPPTEDEEALGSAFDQQFPEFDDALAMIEKSGSANGIVAMGLQLRWDLSGALPRLQMGSFCKARFVVSSDAEDARIKTWWRAFQNLQRQRLDAF